MTIKLLMIFIFYETLFIFFILDLLKLFKNFILIYHISLQLFLFLLISFFTTNQYFLTVLPQPTRNSII